MPSNISEKNGFRMCTYSTQRFKTLRISFHAAVPMTGNVSANAILPYILHRSCERYPDFIKLKSRLAELYGTVISATVNKIGEAQLLSIRITAIDERFALSNESIKEQCAELLGELIFRPHFENDTFAQKDIELEKRLLIERIESEKGNKVAHALRRCETFMFENELYSIDKYGSAEEIEALTAADIYEAWQNMLKSARIQINCVGSGSFDCVAESFEKELSKIKRENIFKVSTKFVTEVAEKKEIIERTEIQQSKLVMGYRTGVKELNDNFFALRVMTDIFGGSPYSKLFMNVREKLSLCYYCSGRFTRHKGVIMVQAGIEESNKEIAINEINKQLKSIADGEIEDNDIATSVMSLTDSANSVNDNPSDIDSWYADGIFEEKPMTTDDFIKGISDVKKEQICAAAKAVKLDTIYMLAKTEADE